MRKTILNSHKTTLINMLLGTALGSIAVFCPLKSCLAQDASTLPAGEKIVGGNAVFDRTGDNVLNITQKSDRLLIDWSKGFNIGEKATTNFIQPNSTSIVINRVTAKTDDPTLIQGRLNANGHVIILDRNGVIFSKSANVDVGSLVVSTGKIKDKDFLNGKGDVTLTNFADAEVINAGSITVADAGLAAFVAPRVRNDGLIVARKGTVLLGNAKSVTLDLYGDGLIEIDTNGNFHDELIENTGKIDAEGGRVLLTAAVVDKVVKNLVNMSDIKNSDSFKVEKGKIILGSSSDDDEVVIPAPEPEPTPTPVIDPVVVTPEPTPPPVIDPVVVIPEPTPAPVIAPVVVIPEPAPVIDPVVVTLEPVPTPVIDPVVAIPEPTLAPVTDPVVVVFETPSAPVTTPVALTPVVYNHENTADNYILNHIIFGRTTKSNRYAYSLKMEYTHQDTKDDWYLPVRRKDEEKGILFNTLSPAAGTAGCNIKNNSDCPIVG